MTATSYDDLLQNPILRFARRFWYLLVAFALIILVFILSISTYNGARNGLIDRESGVNAQYQANQAELDSFTKKVNEEFAIASEKATRIDKVISDAVRGRYDGDLKASPKPGQTNALISALQEAYPGTAGLDVFDRIVTEISGGRENFKQVQVKLLDQLREYEKFRKTGLVHAFWVNAVGYPELQANLGVLPADVHCNEVVQPNGSCVLHGKNALAQMHLLVTSGQTSQSFATGHEAPLTFPTTPAVTNKP